MFVAIGLASISGFFVSNFLLTYIGNKIFFSCLSGLTGISLILLIFFKSQPMHIKPSAVDEEKEPKTIEHKMTELKMMAIMEKKDSNDDKEEIPSKDSKGSDTEAVV